MNRSPSNSFLGTSLVVLVTILAGGGCAHSPASAKSAASPSAKLHQDMRKLWTDHVAWTRDYIVAAVANQPDQNAAAARLMKNQEDIGDAIATYYGRQAGDDLTRMLKEHIQIAVDLIKAAKANDKPAVQVADARWKQNA